jgi:hypothetical protein
MGSLLHSTGGWRRARIRTAVVRGGTARSRRPRERGNADGELERARFTERARFAQKLDIELRVACRTEAASRYELGTVARELLRGRAYRRLGFVRLSDYARERLGVSARTLHSAAWVATRLDALPIVAAAFDRSELSWAQVRAVCAVAGSEDQEQWLARARVSTVEELERVARALRRDDAGTPDPDSDDGTIDGEPAMRWRIACPARVRALWRRACELASRAAGEPLAAWRAAEIIAPEALSGRPAGVSIVDRTVLACLRLARRARRCDPATEAHGTVADPAASSLAMGVAAEADAAAGSLAMGVVSEHGPEPPTVVTAPAAAASEPERPDTEPLGAASDPFALDARLVAAMRAIRTSEPRIGRLLRIVVDQHVYRAFGFTSLAAYVRERLGISTRKAWALLKVERSTRRADAFTRAYNEGAICWVCALTLLPVVDRENAAAWIARADAVTLRRLADEVSWVLEARDLLGTALPLDPPPLDSVLVSPVAQVATTSTAIVQIGAHAPLQNLCQTLTPVAGRPARSATSRLSSPRRCRWSRSCARRSTRSRSPARRAGRRSSACSST